MIVVLETESIRLVKQQRLDQLKTARERNKWGQFATPPVLSLDIARYAWNKLKDRDDGFLFLDPAIGTGSFFAAFLQAFPQHSIKAAVGIELDAAFADTAKALWQQQGLRVIQGDFTRLRPKACHNVVLTNPPYVRHHHLTAEEKKRLRQLAFEATGLPLSGLSGLYCYFLLIAHAWLAENGLAAWLIPSEFMDVNYGDEVKRYLTERVSLLHIHRFCPSDVQFDDALVSSAIVVFEKRQPKTNHKVVFSFGGMLTEPARSETIGLDRLRSTRKWSSLSQQGGNGQKIKVVTIGDLFTVRRGLATGNNDFFIIPKARLHDLGIPLEFVRPILPSPRFLKQEVIEADSDGWPVIDRQLGLIDCRLSEDEIRRKWPEFAEYLQAGKKQGIHEGYLTSRRSPWYSQENRAPAPLLCTYMGRSRERPFRFIWNKSKATAANVYLMLYPKESVAEAVRQQGEVVRRSLQAICPEDFFDEGRVYGGGLHKIEPAELMRVSADDIAEVLRVTVSQQLSLF